MSFKTAPNFESPTDANQDNFYLVEVQASDGAGGIDTQLLTVEVLPLNDAPVITSNGGGAVANVNVVENSTAVTTVTASDDENAFLTYFIVGGADAAKFSIGKTAGSLTFKTAPDFETKADANGDGVYEVIVEVRDGRRDSRSASDQRDGDRYLGGHDHDHACRY